jgi:SAM-dependent methyltransferase
MEMTMTSLEKERGLERGLVQIIFRPCAVVLATFVDGLNPLRRILDVGCGSGIVARTIAVRYPRLTKIDGLDIEEAAIHVAKEQTIGDERFSFNTGDATNFHADLPYDAVIAQHLLHQLGTDALQAVRCMRDALRPGGRVVIGQWPSLEQCPAYTFIYRTADEYAENSKPDMTQAQIEELVRAVGGMKVIEAVLKTDFSTPPVTPRDLLRQYFDGSERWQRAAESAKVRVLERLSDTSEEVFGLGMFVVVAERS